MTQCALFQPVEVQSKENEAERPSHPYHENFLMEQGKQKLELKSERKAKRAKVQSVTPAVKHQNEVSRGECYRHQEDPVTLLCQQLAIKTEECRKLRDRLESIEAANTTILRNQMDMQEKFVKVMYLKFIYF